MLQEYQQSLIAAPMQNLMLNQQEQQPPVQTPQAAVTIVAPITTFPKSKLSKSKLPPVDTVHSMAAQRVVVCDERGAPYNCILNQTNISSNNNKFYIIQLLQDTTKSSAYEVLTRWGRVRFECT